MRYTSFVLYLFTVGSLFAQSITFSPTRAADKEFEKFSYARAAELYQASLESADDSLYILRQLGLCYKNINDTEKAEKYFSKVVSNPDTPPEFSYYYAQALTSNSKYAEAKRWYRIYQEKISDDPRAAEKLQALENFHRFFTDSSRFEIKRVEFNSPGLDFSPALYEGGIVFASSRPTGKDWIKTDFNWDESRFLNLYQVKPGTQEAEQFIDHIQTKYHEGPLAFYNSDQNVVFTRNNVDGRKLKKDSEGVTRLKLFFAESDGKGGWANIQPFEYNSDEYSVGHPAINEDGSVMIFSSDMEGGYGESDLYIVFKQGENWSAPQNLGDKVNTAGKEMFPSLVASNLYFASDGRGGLGGLDIFEANLSRQFEVVSVSNVGAPLNSAKDDFGLVSNDQFRTGYFTSARVDSLKDDIYYFSRDYYNLSGTVVNAETNEAVVGADIFIAANDELIYQRSSSDGGFLVEDIDPKKWEVTGVKFQFEKSEVQVVNISENQNEYEIKILLNPVEEFPVDLPSPLTEFLTAISADPSKGGAGMGVGDTLNIQPIYYDFDKSDLRVAGEEELDKLLGIMDEFPNLIIGLFSHTDFKGDKEYNLLLSQRRANAAFDYLVEKGMDPDRLQPSGKGESMPEIECTDCTEEQDQRNRRTEFVIVGLKADK